MWLVQLYKADDNATLDDGLYSTNDCTTNYISAPTNIYEEAQLNLCNSWDYNEKRRILVIKKNTGTFTLNPLHNERFMYYLYRMGYGSLGAYQAILCRDYLENTNSFIDFYVITKIQVRFEVPNGTLPNSDLLSRTLSFLEYLRGKTLKIGIPGHETPKYSIEFDDNCYYYYDVDDDLAIIFIIKNPFLFFILLDPIEDYFDLMTNMKPTLIEDFNDYESTDSIYNPDSDRALLLDEVIEQHFNVAAKTGISNNNIGINDTTNIFGYNLTRALLGTFKNEIASNYYFSLDDTLGYVIPSSNTYIPLEQQPLCIYFPLLRPQLDNNGHSSGLPQYDPNDTRKYVHSFSLYIRLNSNGEVQHSALYMSYGDDLSNLTYCGPWSYGSVPSWRSNTCDITLPFRFAGISDCTEPDYWNNETAIHNANYLFLIVKPAPTDPSTVTYNIKGIGCGELTTEVTTFSDFRADYNFFNVIAARPLTDAIRINPQGGGYPIDEISNELSSYRGADAETYFVLFNESIVDNRDDFYTLYQSVTSALPNSIVCYIGSDEKIPNDYKSKVVHSNAIVTDLDTNEQVPLVIKYINYAKKLHKLLNGQED